MQVVFQIFGLCRVADAGGDLFHLFDEQFDHFVHFARADLIAQRGHLSPVNHCNSFGLLA